MSRVGKQIYPEADDDSVLHTTYYHALKYGTQIAVALIGNDLSGLVHAVTDTFNVIGNNDFFDFDFSGVIGTFINEDYGVVGTIHVDSGMVEPSSRELIRIIKTSTTRVRVMLSASFPVPTAVNVTLIFIGQVIGMV